MLEIADIAGPCVSALCAFGGSWLAFSTRLTRVETKVDALSDRVEKHNNVVERTSKLETDVTNIYHKISDVNDDIHRYHG